MKTEQEWLDYLKWFHEQQQTERENNIRLLYYSAIGFFGAGAAFINGILSINTILLVFGLAFLILFGFLAYLNLKHAQHVSYALGFSRALIHAIMVEKLDIAKISEQYQKHVETLMSWARPWAAKFMTKEQLKEWGWG